MLTRTFCHIPGVGAQTEQRLWAEGVRHWQDAAAAELPGRRGSEIRAALRISNDHLAAGDTRYFGRALPSREQWRLFADFRDRVAYFDIETTGLSAPRDYVTSIALYDGRDVRHYVRGENLDQFAADAARYDLLVSYNGKSFDVPFVRSAMGVDLDHAHIDLMHVLRSLGYTGGLKGIEKQLGYDREDLADVDGYFAVRLWNEYQRTGDAGARETLLAYNVQDVLTLEHLMVFAFNAKLRDTPFADELQLPAPAVADNPFTANRDVIDRLQGIPSPNPALYLRSGAGGRWPFEYR